VIVGLLPLAWGAWSWLSSARAELDAQERDDVLEATDRTTELAPPALARKARTHRTAKFP
jgi:hypothetical protein